MMEFHISRSARDRYHLADTLFSFNGNVVFANLSACRALAHRINLVRDAKAHPERAVHAGKLYAMGLIDEAAHALMARYRRKFDSNVMTDALAYFGEQVGQDELDKLLLAFVEQFPGTSVYRGDQKASEWLADSTEGTAHRAAAFEEMILLWMANRNLAFRPFEELFRDRRLADTTVYRRITQRLPAYFATRPLIPIAGAAPISLFDLLHAPTVSAPFSLTEQLAVIRGRWQALLGKKLQRLLLLASDVLHEEEVALWMLFHPRDEAAEAAARAAAEEAARRARERGMHGWAGLGGVSEVPDFADAAHEYEKFSPDVAWMPTAVLVAKSTYVWLAQLSRKYSRDIRRLDQIPDEDLDELARRGLNSLWLIGIWERSRASRTIKQLCGNQDAVASAYSLYDYRIADDLGGEAAYLNLRDRCYHRGIRLASDMVPNHMGIDSPWVVEHPDWFLSRPDSPYPAYDFNGPDLSSDPRVEIRIERHYYEQTDAAVVFQRRDRATGEVRYVYHGNDGTSFPWNDTAQIDYLNPAAREAVIQTILHVCRLFPLVRFDAAMTLAKRHFQRLWFPNPGSSGAIPSRAEYGMTTEEFSRQMPQEFWREVVDRVAAEVPNTLLLAEAFWLMEGYFVRTLGMHRVYNSAFMNMMRDEDNAKYRSVLKNTLEFDPDILKRYVNFMSNPDERTAIDQFGTGDKCFGVATMMATLPGLPMFGHGQIEGFTEKYGMEYRWPRYQEDPDPALVARHERQIAPLLHQRDLFAESANFLLYDFYREDGSVDEDVFAYSNRLDSRRALVLYHNHYSGTRGTIDTSASFADKGSGQVTRRRLGEGLELSGDPAVTLAFRDALSGLHYLRRADAVANRGFFVELEAYRCHVFLDWSELRSTAEEPWDRLCDDLAGRGVSDLHAALRRLELRPAHDALRRLLDPVLVRQLVDVAEAAAAPPDKNRPAAAMLEEFSQSAWQRCHEFLGEAHSFYRHHDGALSAEGPGPASLEAKFHDRLRVAARIPTVESVFPRRWPLAARSVLPSVSPHATAMALWGPVLAWCVLELLAESVDGANRARSALDLFNRLELREPLAQAFQSLGLGGDDGWRAAARVKAALLVEAGVFDAAVSATKAEPVRAGKKAAAGKKAPAVKKAAQREAAAPLRSPAFWQDADIAWLTGLHEAEGHSYFVQEPFEELLWWFRLPALYGLAAQARPSRPKAQQIERSLVQEAKSASAAGYRVDRLISGKVSEKATGAVVVEAKAKSVARRAVKEAVEKAAKSRAKAPAKRAVKTAAKKTAKQKAKAEPAKSAAKPPAKRSGKTVKPKAGSAAKPTAKKATAKTAKKAARKTSAKKAPAKKKPEARAKKKNTRRGPGGKVK